MSPSDDDDDSDLEPASDPVYCKLSHKKGEYHDYDKCSLYVKKGGQKFMFHRKTVVRRGYAACQQCAGKQPDNDVGENGENGENGEEGEGERSEPPIWPWNCDGCVSKKDCVVFSMLIFRNGYFFHTVIGTRYAMGRCSAWKLTCYRMQTSRLLQSSS